MIRIKARKLTSFSDKIKGLIGANEIVPTYFETRFGIHTFFVKHPIDVLILDADYRVKVMRESLNPRRIFLWSPKFYKVLELPGGFIKRAKIKKDDQVIIDKDNNR